MDQEIIQLHLQGRTIQEISEITGKSYYYIKQVIKSLDND